MASLGLMVFVMYGTSTTLMTPCTLFEPRAIQSCHKANARLRTSPKLWSSAHWNRHNQKVISAQNADITPCFHIGSSPAFVLCTSAMSGNPLIEIIDIRESKDSYGSTPHLRSEIIQGLSKPPGKRTLPPELLYDEVGLKIYNEELNYWSKWYYPLVAEKEIVMIYGDKIAEQLKRSQGGRAVLVELGAG